MIFTRSNFLLHQATNKQEIYIVYMYVKYGKRFMIVILFFFCGCYICCTYVLVLRWEIYFSANTPSSRQELCVDKKSTSQVLNVLDCSFLTPAGMMHSVMILELLPRVI